MQNCAFEALKASPVTLPDNTLLPLTLLAKCMSFGCCVCKLHCTDHGVKDAGCLSFHVLVEAQISRPSEAHAASSLDPTCCRWAGTSATSNVK